MTTKQLNQQVSRNRKRFPDDFMFRLTKEEAEALRSQFVTSNAGRGGRRYLPHAFTEQGVAMLSSVLSSDQAIEVNIAIMRVRLTMKRSRIFYQVSRGIYGFTFTITLFPAVPRTLRLTRTSTLLAISSGNFTTICLSQPKFGTAPKYSTVSGKT